MSKNKNKKIDQYEQNQPADETKKSEAVEQENPLTPEQERDELLGRLQRLAADYQNYQKRSQKEVSQAREFANESLIKQLLPVLDDMERAMQAARENAHDDDPLLKGMQLVHDNMLNTLTKFGVETIESKGQQFDPEKHSAMMQQETTDAEPMTVLQEVQKGYLLKGRAIRPAAVIVAKAPEASEDVKE